MFLDFYLRVAQGKPLKTAERKLFLPLLVMEEEKEGKRKYGASATERKR
jgi:hypothetical protein